MEPEYEWQSWISSLVICSMFLWLSKAIVSFLERALTEEMGRPVKFGPGVTQFVWVISSLFYLYLLSTGVIHHARP